jgi:hypothetical protein
VLIEELVAQAPDGPVDLDWLLGQQDKRSFGLLLLLGLLVIVPGVASIATLMVIFPSVEMMLGRSRPSFPRFLSKRPFDFKRFKRLTEIVQPGLRAIENLSRPRCTLPHAAAHRMVGAVVFLFGVVGHLAAAVGERHPGSRHHPHRDRLPSGGRPPSGGRLSGGVPVVGGLRMDRVDVGRSPDAVDGPPVVVRRETRADAIITTVVSKGAFLNPKSTSGKRGFRMARVFVTGSADGLGKMAAELLIEKGHKVLLHARSAARADQTRKKRSAAPRASSIGDLSSIAETKSIADHVNKLGGFDAVIHNAGIGYREPNLAKTVDGLLELFAVNSLAPYILTA